MKNYLGFAAFALALLPCATAADDAATTVKVGGVSVSLPAPTSDFLEVGEEHRSVIFQVFVPTENRLLRAYVPAKDLPTLGQVKGDAAVPVYAMVEVARRAEPMDCGPDDFKEVVSSASESMGSIVSSISKDTEAEMNRRLQALDLDRLELGEVKQIGGFFSKTDAYGFGLVTVVKMGGREAKMGMGGVLLRVRKRLLFGYLYSEYKGVETADWLRKTTEQWADAIQAANRDAAPAAQPARARVPAKQ